MYYILRFLQHACSVIKFVILTIVCRSKSASELMLHCYVYSTLNKSSMSMSMSMSMGKTLNGLEWNSIISSLKEHSLFIYNLPPQ